MGAAASVKKVGSAPEKPALKDRSFRPLDIVATGSMANLFNTMELGGLGAESGDFSLTMDDDLESLGEVFAMSDEELEAWGEADEGQEDAAAAAAAVETVRESHNVVKSSTTLTLSLIHI